MTRDEYEIMLSGEGITVCLGVEKIHSLLAHDAEQRLIIDEQLEENRGLRRDVLLMQQANAEQRQQIEQQAVQIEHLKEWKRIVLGTGTDQEAVIRMAAAEYTQVAVQAWKEKVEQQAQEISRLREALEGMVFIFGHNDGYAQVEEAKAALEEQP